MTLFLAGVASASAVSAALFYARGMALGSVLLAGVVCVFGRGDAAEQPRPQPFPFASRPSRARRLPARLCPPAEWSGAASFARQCYFPVAQGGKVVGVLSKAALLRAVANDWGDGLIVELMAQNAAAAECRGGEDRGADPASKDSAWRSRRSPLNWPKSWI